MARFQNNQPQQQNNNVSNGLISKKKFNLKFNLSKNDDSSAIVTRKKFKNIFELQKVFIFKKGGKLKNIYKILIFQIKKKGRN